MGISSNGTSHPCKSKVESEVLSSKPIGCMWNLPIKKKQKKGLLSQEVCDDTKSNGVYDFMYLARVTLVIHCQVNLLHKNIVYDALLCGCTYSFNYLSYMS